MLMVHLIALGRALAKPCLTDIDFCGWIVQAGPGDELEYHRGFLGIDTTTLISILQEEDRRRLVTLAGAALRASDAGLVHLVQRRLGPDRFAYLAVARPKPSHPPVSLSTLLSEEAA